MVDEREFLVDEGKGLGDFLAALKRRRWLGLLTAAAVFIAGALAILFWPTLYTSTAVVLIEEPEVPQELVQTTVTTFAAQQIQLINQRVMTRSNLAGIIEKFDLYAEKRKHLPTLMLTEDVEESINMDLINVELNDPTSNRPALSTIAFTIGFEHDDQKIAQQVANDLVSLYLEENVRSRTVQTAETSEFLTEEVERLDQEVKDLEAKIARFKELNNDSLPQLSQLNSQIIQRTEDQLLEINRQIRSIEESRVLLQAQLAQVDRTAPTILADGRAVVSPTDQLKALQTQLAMLEGKYSPSHPDVMRARREVEALQQQTGITADLSQTAPALADAKSRLARARETYSAEHPEVKRLEREVASLELATIERGDSIDSAVIPDNPAYIQITAQLNSLTAEENSLRTQAGQLRARISSIEQNMLAAPQVEQELIGLQRELATATQRYVAMRERQFGAEMGQALESQSKGERFVLVEPPNFPLQPSSPNRPALLLLLLVLAPAIGVGIIQLKEAMDDSVWVGKDLESLLGMPPIAEIPMIMTRQEAARHRSLRIAAWAGVPVTMICLVLVVHFAYRPLDILWYSVVRQLGL